jgi:hypothetical protein
VQPLGKTVYRFLKKLKIELPYDPAIPLLGIYLKECKSMYNGHTCTPIFIAALSTITKQWNLPRCPKPMNGFKKMWCIYIMEYYSTIKKNEIMSFAGKRMELEIIMLSKNKPSSEDNYCMFSLMQKSSEG